MIEFWKPRPKPFDIRALSLLIPSIGSAIGFFCFAVLAFSFTEIAQLGATFRQVLVIGGALCLAFGGEIGTLATAVEVHRKERNGSATTGDQRALKISIGATLGEFVIAFATLLGTKARWGTAAQEWGVIALGILAVLDAYAGFREFGYYLGEYDERLEAWKQQRDDEAERLRQKEERRDDRRANLALRLELAEMERASQVEDSPSAAQESARETQEERKLDIALTPEERRAQLLALYGANPALRQQDAAARLGVSRQTISNDVAQLERIGAIRRNGHGVEVLEDANAAH